MLKLLTGENSITGLSLRIQFYRWVLERVSPPKTPFPNSAQILSIFTKRSISGMEGKVYWASLRGSLGCEIMGKRLQQTRPVLIILDRGCTVSIIPLTSQYHSSPWCVPIQGTGKPAWANVRQIRTLDKRRIQRKLCNISHEDFSHVLATCLTELLCPLHPTP